MVLCMHDWCSKRRYSIRYSAHCMDNVGKLGVQTSIDSTETERDLNKLLF